MRLLCPAHTEYEKNIYFDVCEYIGTEDRAIENHDTICIQKDRK